MSLSTFPGTATTSATLPASSVPTSASIPSSFAASRVPDCNAAAGLIPRSVMSPNSIAFIPWGYTPASVPKAMGTPMRSAALNIAPWAAAAARALAAICGGYVSASLPTQYAARRVGTRYTPLAFINLRVASVRKLPCSIESMPASTANLAARSPCACAAVLSFGKDGGQLGRGELWHVHGIGLGKHAARRADFDDICAPLHLIAHG